MTRGFEEEEPPISDGVRCFLLNIHGWQTIAAGVWTAVKPSETRRAIAYCSSPPWRKGAPLPRRSSKPSQCSDIPLRKAMLAPTPSRQKSQLRTIERFFAQGPNRILASICTGLKRGPSRLRHGDPQMGQECVAASAGRAQRRRPGRQRSQTCILSVHGFVPGSTRYCAPNSRAADAVSRSPTVLSTTMTSSGEGSRRQSL